jgi:hypothetical protein
MGGPLAWGIGISQKNKLVMKCHRRPQKWMSRRTRWAGHVT